MTFLISPVIRSSSGTKPAPAPAGPARRGLADSEATGRREATIHFVVRGENPIDQFANLLSHGGVSLGLEGAALVASAAHMLKQFQCHTRRCRQKKPLCFDDSYG